VVARPVAIRSRASTRGRTRCRSRTRVQDQDEDGIEVALVVERRLHHVPHDARQAPAEPARDRRQRALPQLVEALHLQVHLGELLGGETEAGEAVERVEQRRVRLLVLLELAAEVFPVAGVVQGG
jgi:hypothetical protein